MEEIWKLITGTSEYYISNKGNVKRVKQDLTKGGNVRSYSIVKERILKQDTSVKGYHTVHVPMIDGKTRHLRVHRLVAEAFIPNPNNFPQVNHIDGNKGNNQVNNLEWCTAKSNNAHARSSGLWDSFYEKGENNKNSKLTEDMVKQIPNLLQQGLKPKQIADKFGVSRAAINLIRKGENWKYLNLFHN